MRVKLSSESATTPVSAVTAPPTPAWDQPPWDLTDPCSLRWAALVLMAALAWEAQLQDLERFSMTKMTGQTQKRINLAWMMTIGKKLIV